MAGSLVERLMNPSGLFRGEKAVMLFPFQDVMTEVMSFSRFFTTTHESQFCLLTQLENYLQCLESYHTTK